MKNNWYSSYEANSYGDLFYCLVRIYQPEKVVELGTRAGYSAYHMARALKDNSHGSLDCYDLWENHLENLGLNMSKSDAEENLKEFSSIVNLNLADALEVDEKYDTIDILHVDLDNDGGILEQIVPVWIDKVRQLIIIEGGSPERDQLASVTDYKKLPVSKWLNDLNDKQAKSVKEVFTNQNDPDQFVIVGGKKEYREKPIAPWLEDLSKKRKDIECFTFTPFPSLTIIRKK